MTSSELVLARDDLIGGSELSGFAVHSGRASDGARVWRVELDAALLAGSPEEWRSSLDRSALHAAGVRSWARVVHTGVESGKLVVAYAPLIGTLLSELLTNGLERERGLSLLRSLADALAILHGQGLAHGLLRPDLIGVDRGEVCIAGLGLAELFIRFGAARAHGPALSTPDRAPEHAQLDPSLDVHAFGTIAAKLVPGHAGIDAALARALSPEERVRPLDLPEFARELALLAASAASAAGSDAAAANPAGSVDGASPAVSNVDGASPAVSKVEAASTPEASQLSPVPPPLPPAPELSQERARPELPQVAPPHTAKPARSSLVTLLVVLPIVLGFLTLLGGAAGVVAFAMRRAPPSPSATPSATAVAPAPMAPRPAEPDRHFPPHAAAPKSEEPAMPAGPVPSPGAERVRPLEASALLPVTSERPIWGTPDALATVAVFGDLECSPTRSALRSALRIQSELGAAVRFVFYQAPQATHPNAREAARVLAHASLRHGSDVAWRLLGNVATSRAPATPDELTRWLGALALPGTGSAATDNEAGLEQLEEDEKLGILLDLRATPTLFVNGARIEGAPSDALLQRRIDEEARAVRWLRAEGLSAEEAYVRRVRRNLLNIELGAVDRACIPDDGAPSDGPRDALVSIVEFSDFECPHCRRVQPALRAVLARHRTSVRRVWRSFALPQHERARRVASFALAARAAGGDSAFWAVHDALFGAEDRLEDAELAALATRLGLNGEALLAALDDPRTVLKLKTDEALAADLELAGTPTLFVNGRRLSGAIPEPILEAVVQEELETARRLVRRGTAPARFAGVLCGTGRKQ